MKSLFLAVSSSKHKDNQITLDLIKKIDINVNFDLDCEYLKFNYKNEFDD